LALKLCALNGLVDRRGWPIRADITIARESSQTTYVRIQLLLGARRWVPFAPNIARQWRENQGWASFGEVSLGIELSMKSLF
jgi:hypothetical protein